MKCFPKQNFKTLSLLRFQDFACQFISPWQLEIGPDGSVYIMHWKTQTIRPFISPEMVVECIGKHHCLCSCHPTFREGYLYLLLNFANLRKTLRQSNSIPMEQMGNLTYIPLRWRWMDLFVNPYVLRGPDGISLGGRRRENSGSEQITTLLQPQVQWLQS